MTLSRLDDAAVQRAAERLRALRKNLVADHRSPFLVALNEHWETIFPAWLAGAGWVDTTRNLFPKRSRPGVRTVRRLMLVLLEIKGIPTTRAAARSQLAIGPGTSRPVRRSSASLQVGV